MECSAAAQQLVSICPVEVRMGVLGFQRMGFVAHFCVEADGWRNHVPPVNCLVLGSGVSVRLQTTFPFLSVVSELNLAGDDRRNRCDRN